MSLFPLIAMGGKLGVRCAWCNLVMREPEVRHAPTTLSDHRLVWSHGICAACRAQIEETTAATAEPAQHASAASR